MALLTEEQINDILDMAEVHADSFCGRKIIKWNAQQTTRQFEVDWSKAPRGAKGAILKSYWVGGSMCAFGQTVAEYKRPAPVITPHLHAEIIAKYAEVAARRFDPWVEFQVYKTFFGLWVTLDAPTWFDTAQQYRYIGDDK